MHFIIVEDLENDRQELWSLIRKDFKAAHLPAAEFSFYESGEEFLKNYRKGICDALFLDIMMDGISGIKVAEKVRDNDNRLPIIFTTAEPDFALEGFSVHAMDYLLKPLSPQKVSWCLKELREYMLAPTYITISQIDGWGHSHTDRLALDSIIYAQYQNHIIEIHTSSGTVLTRLSFQSCFPKMDAFMCAAGAL